MSRTSNKPIKIATPSLNDSKRVSGARVTKLSQDNLRKSSTSSTSSRATSIPRRSPPPHGVLSDGEQKYPSCVDGNKQISGIVRRTRSSNSTCTSLLPEQFDLKNMSLPNLHNVTDSVERSTSSGPATVTWGCGTDIVSDQQVQTFYQKPTYTEGTRFDPITRQPIPGSGQIQSYGKMSTKTVTVTITTTIASTEILKPGEEGYEASLEREKEQRKTYQIMSNSPMTMEPDSIEDQEDIEDDYEMSSTEDDYATELYDSEKASSIMKLEDDE